MNTRKLLVAIIFLSSTQLAFASSSIDNLTQKVFATKRFELKVNALTDNPVGGAAAANDAIQLWLSQLVQFVHDHKNA